MDELEIFTEAKNLANAAERRDYLDRVCRGAPQLRQRLECLLEKDRSDHLLLDRPLSESGAASLLAAAEEAVVAAPLDDAEVLAQIAHLLTPSSREGALGRLGHYDVLQLLGYGGYGILLKAFDEKLHRVVALKLLSPSLAAISPPRKRFLREARAAAAVRHENVVQIHAVEESPIPYLVMEYIAGKTLQQRFEDEGPFEAAEVVRLGLQIAHGLAAAHAQGIIHRDIKPANILLESHPVLRVKLTDFGLARTADDASQSCSGFLAGTPMFMSPEQAQGRELDHRADLFSLGSVLYMMCTGRPPFRAPTTLAVLKRVAEDTPRPIREIIPDIPVGLCRVIERLHAKRPEQRFDTIGETIDALQSCLDSRRQAGKRYRRGTVLGLAAAVTVALLALVIWLGNGPRNWPEKLLGRNDDASRAAISESKTPPPLTGIVAASATAKVSAPTLEASVDSAYEIAATLKRQLLERNPQLSESSIHLTIEQGALVEVKINPSNNLSDLTPLQNVKSLKRFLLWSSQGGALDLKPLNKLSLRHFDSIGHAIADLRPLEGMPLEFLGLWQWAGGDLSPLRTMPHLHAATLGGCNLSDLEALRGIRFRYLCLNHTKVSDISPLSGMPLEMFEMEHTLISDLSPLRGAALKRLAARGSPVTDFSPVRDAPLDWISLDYNRERDESILRSFTGLQTINDLSTAEFWQRAASQ